MVIIRAEQYAALEQAARRRYQVEMAAYSKKLSPDLCRVLGDAQLNAALRQAMERAVAYGFTDRGPIRLYVQLMFFWGSDFDTDPQFLAVGELLRSNAAQMERATEIHKLYLEYFHSVAGADAGIWTRGLGALPELFREPRLFVAEGLNANIVAHMVLAFPQRGAFVGERALLALVDEARIEGQRYGLAAPRALVLLTALKYYFGHGCMRDPLYPWILRTLEDDRIVAPAARAARLERKLLTWMDHVLARLREKSAT